LQTGPNIRRDGFVSCAFNPNGKGSISPLISILHNGPETLRIGFLAADGVEPERRPSELDGGLDEMLSSRAAGLSGSEDAWRQQVRDILRNGKYKPTGRGKPASEYLLRAASEGGFPRINALVDICNYISLSSLLPISIWDLDRAGSSRYVLRLGFEGESYVFNDAGQSIDLKDLLVGCAVDDAHPDGLAVVNPVKDSMVTKTSEATCRVGALVYACVDDGPIETLEATCARFADLLAGCGSGATSSFRIVRCGESGEF